MVSTNNIALAAALESTRSHGRVAGDAYFDHIRWGINSKMNDMEASLGLEGIENFWETFWVRYANIQDMRIAAEGFEDKAWFSEEDEGNVNCPHGFSITCKYPYDIQKVKDTFDKYKIHWKRNFGCVPLHHQAFRREMGFSYHPGDFPAAEWVGNNGIHIGCHQYLSDSDMDRI